jgi:hypothetical protein
MRISKTISLLLAIMLLLTTLIACGDTSSSNVTETTTAPNGETVTDEATETTFNYDPGLPGADYGGRTFNILTKAVATYTDWGETSIWTESENGDAVNDSIYQRNRAIEETYNIVIAEYQSGAVVGDIQKSVSAGDGAYDVVMPALGDSGTLAAGGYLVDLFTLDHVNFTQPWWDQRSVEDLSITNKLFFVSSDTSTLNNDATWVTMFNKEMIEAHSLTSPYEHVANNTWTYETFYNQYKGVYMDLDGDGETGAYDTYPNLTQNENYNAMFIGGGERLIAKNADDVPVIALGNDERSIRVLEIMNSIMNDKEFSLNYHNYGSLGYHLWTTTMFEESRGLYWITCLQIVIRLRDLATPMGVVPVPKFSEDQERYANVVWTVGSFSAVPKTTPDMECTGMILEAMAAKSMELLRPAYYDIALNGKFLRDEESVEMMDIIISERVYDLGLAFNFGSIMGVLDGLVAKGSSDIVSAMASKTSAIQTAIDKIIDNFNENT